MCVHVCGKFDTQSIAERKRRHLIYCHIKHCKTRESYGPGHTFNSVLLLCVKHMWKYYFSPTQQASTDILTFNSGNLTADIIMYITVWYRAGSEHRLYLLLWLTSLFTYVLILCTNLYIYFAKIVHKLTYLLVISWQELSMYYTFRAVLNSKVKQKWIGNKSFFKWRVRNPCLFATAGYCSHLHKSAPSRQANCARDTLFNNGPG